MTSRIAATFKQLAADRRKALVPYLTAGFPTRADTLPVMHAMVSAGADVIEIGVPFSDPAADGPTIQRANEIALSHHVTLIDVLDYVVAFRRTDTRTPIVLMGYANPIERLGPDVFLDAARAAGVDGLIVVDYPPEESEQFLQAATARGIDLIFLLAPTSTDQRIANACQLASGYLYYVSLKGTTGGTLDPAQVVNRVALLRARTPLPICVGFGIRDAITAKAIGLIADGVIIGSQMIQVMQNAASTEVAADVSAFVTEIRTALDSIDAG